jgi:hypothetical protein
MKPIIAVGFTFAFLALLGCGQRPIDPPAGGAASSKTDNKKAFQTLAQHLGDTWTSDRHAPDPKKDEIQLLAEGQALILALNDLNADDSKLLGIRDQGRRGVQQAIDAVRRIKVLPKPPGLFELCLNSFALGFALRPDLGIEEGMKAQSQGEAIQTEIRRLIQGLEDAQVAKLLLRGEASRYSGPAFKAPEAIGIDVDEAIAPGPDWIALTNNSGQDLTNVLASVTLLGHDGETKENIHFVPHWRHKEAIHARYEGGFLHEGRRVGGQTVVLIQKVNVSVYAQEGKADQVYQYAGAEKEKDIQGLLDSLKIDATFRPFKRGIIFDDQRAVQVSFAGQETLQKCRATVTLHRLINRPVGLSRPARAQANPADLFGPPTSSKTIDLNNWRSGSQQTIEFPGLPWDPIRYDVSISLQGYRASVTRTFSR